jgi:hypothetical protein
MDSSKEFLNPSSMLTPGLAGGMTMGITNVMAAQFSLIPPGTAWLGLGLSFLFGLLVWVNQDVSRLKRLVFYVLNSLVIFVVAMGSNTVGGAVSGKAVAAAAAGLTDVLVPSAFAQSKAAPPQTGWCCVDRRLSRSGPAECQKAAGRFTLQEDAARAACTAAAPVAPAKAPPENNKFFRSWIAPAKG